MSADRRPLATLRERIVRYGRETTSFQTIEPGLSYWFDPDSDACVAYADTGSAWVSVGPPLAELGHEDEVAFRFVAAARKQRRRACFFAVEREEFGDANMCRLHLGEQPYWDPQHWPQIVRGKRSLREQLRRARAKHVTVRRLKTAELSAPDGATRRAIDELIERWLDSREMAPMGFVVKIDLDTLVEERCVFVAELDCKLVGVLAAVPIPARADHKHAGRSESDDELVAGEPLTHQSAWGWFFEDVLRYPEAPNGTIELLFDHAMRYFGARGCHYVTYGLAPLAHTPSPMLRWIRDHTRWLYHFDGLRAFKAKLRPDGWRAVYLAYQPRSGLSTVSAAQATIDALSAFAGGSLLRFGLATLRHRASWVTRILAWLLLPWTSAMLMTDSARWFPSLSIKLAWVGFDLILFGLLLVLARHWRRRLAIGLAVLAGCDFMLGCAQAGLYNLPRADGLLDWVVTLLALGAPLFAALFLWYSRNRVGLYVRT